MDVYSHLLTERIVYLGTAIDAGVANALIAQLLHLEADSPEREISLYINCEGGDLPSMLAVYDTMQHIKAPVAPPASARPSRSARCCWRRAPRAGARSCRTPAWCCTSRRRSGRGAIPDLILQADELVRMRADLEEILAAPHRADRGAPAPRHRPRPGLHGAAAVEYGLADQVLGPRE